jgi:two-component system sensor histidine kinase DesK
MQDNRSMDLPIALRRPELGRVVAAVATWAVVFGVSLRALLPRPDTDAGTLAATATVQVAYLLAMLEAFRVARRDRLRARFALSVQLLCALLAGALVPVDFLPIYTIVWMAMVPSFVESRRTAFLLLGAVMLSWHAIRGAWWEDPTATSEILLWSVFHLFALHSALETRSASRARDQVATLNRELIAARHLLEEASRSEERTRIARDLHDLLGHHMTALLLELQVAGHHAEGEVRERIERCRALARLLMGDVREAVTQLRDDGGPALSTALRALADAVPLLRVELSVPDELHVQDLETARTLLRCVQEALTNTLRHAGASTCWIRVGADEHGVSLDVHDDGRVRGALHPGHGLTGMRERVEALDGTLRLEQVGQALALHVRLPIAARGSA